MRSITFFALASGLGSTLLWIALICITTFAIILYLPQRFSGPLTTPERRAFGRVHRRTLAVVLVAPVATVLGLALLLPPPVELHAAGHLAGTPAIDGPRERSILSYLASRRSTREWMEAVRCRIGPSQHGADALAEAIVRAATEQFVTTAGCLSNPRPVDAWEATSIELSLVELASRAYHLTGLHVSAGPRLNDPDPWDIMAQRLEARGGPTPTLGRSRTTTPGESRVLRLSHARLRHATEPSRLTVFALVEGPTGGDFHGSLVNEEGRSVDSGCLLRPQETRADRQDSESRHILQMRVECPSLHAGQVFREPTVGLLLVADDGETPIRSLGRRPLLGVHISGIDDSLSLANSSDAFTDELHQRGLAALRADTSSAIEISGNEDEIVLSRRDKDLRSLLNCDPRLDTGPFSWAGIGRPTINFEGGRIKIGVGASLLDVESNDYEPSAFMALIYTITWAANALDSGICVEAEGKLPGRRQAHPVLTAEQIDVAVAALRRDRDSFGLVLLALALASLALGLRRSAV